MVQVIHEYSTYFPLLFRLPIQEFILGRLISLLINHDFSKSSISLFLKSDFLLWASADFHHYINCSLNFLSSTGICHASGYFSLCHMVYNDSMNNWNLYSAEYLGFMMIYLWPGKPLFACSLYICYSLFYYPGIQFIDSAGQPLLIIIMNYLHIE